MELNAQGISQRSIEASVHSSHQTVKAALDRAQELHITWPLDNDVTNEMLDELEAVFKREKQFTSDVSHELRTLFLTQSSTTSTSTVNCPRRVSRSRCSGNKYGITRGASYWKKGGGGHAE